MSKVYTGSKEASDFIKQYRKQIIIILLILALGLTLYLLAA